MTTKTLPHVDPAAIVGAVAAAGFNTGLAIATDAEIAAGAACGQMALLVEDLEAIKKELEGCGTWTLRGSVPETFTVVEDSGWEELIEFEHREVICKHAPTGTYWEVCGSRCGTYPSGYAEYLDSVKQVRPVEKVITVWEVV